MTMTSQSKEKEAFTKYGLEIVSFLQKNHNVISVGPCIHIYHDSGDLQLCSRPQCASAGQRLRFWILSRTPMVPLSQSWLRKCSVPVQLFISFNIYVATYKAENVLISPETDNDKEIY